LTPYVLMGVCHPLQPAGLSCMDNVVKECQEEASIPAALAKTARPVGVVSYAGDSRCACDAGMDGPATVMTFCMSIGFVCEFMYFDVGTLVRRHG